MSWWWLLLHFAAGKVFIYIKQSNYQQRTMAAGQYPMDNYQWPIADDRWPNEYVQHSTTLEYAYGLFGYQMLPVKKTGTACLTIVFLFSLLNLVL